MDILFLADNFPPERNAQASRVYERARYWVRWGHRVTVITCAPNFPEGRLYPGYANKWHQVSELGGVRVVRVKTFIAPNAGVALRVLDFLSFMTSGFCAGLFQKRPDLVVPTSPQFFVAIAGWALAAVRRIPFVLEVADLWPESIVAVGAMKRNMALRWLEKLELFLYRRAARIVAVTSGLKHDMVQRGVPAEKIDVVRNGVDLEMYGPRPKDLSFARQWGLAEDHLVVGYIGTHGMAHALSNVLAAAEACKGNVRFLFVGAGAERERLVAEAKRRSLDNVIFVPAQPKEQVPAFWSLCDVALVHLKNTPLFKSALPAKMFEAMGMGLPIMLACPEGEASELVRREGAGIWAPPEDPGALAQAIQLLNDNRSLLGQLAEGSKAAAPRYSRERQAREMLASLQVALRLRVADPLPARQ